MTAGTVAQDGAPGRAPTENLGPTLRAMRLGASLSQTELAERVDATKSTISRFETGERRPSPELLARIARVVADEANRKKAAA